ncbi:MAG: FAD binding domain-containing protein [bacterium]|nr:FAD binding domain-containing protein [bacterium]MCY4272864.1 FAD binding domain-containing protein [bacterium]
MFPSRFDLVVAQSVGEAVEAKADVGEGGRFLAGGQSLIPMMKMRVAFPETLIDINRIAGLDAVERSNGHLHVGALVRHADVAASDAAFGAIAAAAPWVADPLVRNRGTMCGSVAHCDPEGDWNSVLLATGAAVIAQSPGGQRAIPIAEFVQGAFTSALAEDELVTGLRIPVPSGRFGGSYLKLERKIGDYATVAVASHLELDDSGAIAAAGLALTSVNPVNTKVVDAEAVLVGQQPSPEVFAEAAELAAAAAEPRDDVRGTAAWKRQVVRTYAKRGLAAAAQQAEGS